MPNYDTLAEGFDVRDPWLVRHAWRRDERQHELQGIRVGLCVAYNARFEDVWPNTQGERPSHVPEYVCARYMYMYALVKVCGYPVREVAIHCRTSVNVVDRAVRCVIEGCLRNDGYARQLRRGIKLVFSPYIPIFNLEPLPKLQPLEV